MRKVFVLISACTILASCSVWGETSNPMVVTLIAGPEEESESVSLDDIKIGTDIEIDGFATVTPLDFKYVDAVNVNGDWTKSRDEADYGTLFMDFLNTTVKPKDYLANVEVKAVYDDTYEYAGWAYQLLDNDAGDWRGSGDKKYILIDPMYRGHYVFGATLPNAVVNGNKELRFEITIDDNEMIYYAKRGE